MSTQLPPEFIAHLDEGFAEFWLGVKGSGTALDRAIFGTDAQQLGAEPPTAPERGGHPTATSTAGPADTGLPSPQRGGRAGSPRHKEAA